MLDPVGFASDGNKKRMFLSAHVNLPCLQRRLVPRRWRERLRECQKDEGKEVYGIAKSSQVHVTLR